MKEIINSSTFDGLKRKIKQKSMILTMISLVFIVLIILLAVFQVREYMVLFIVLLGFSTSIFLCFLLFYIIQIINPIRKYKKLVYLAIHNQKQEQELILKEVSSIPFTNEGITSKKLVFFKDETLIDLYVEIESFDISQFNINQKYKLFTYHNFIISFEDME